MGHDIGIKNITHALIWTIVNQQRVIGTQLPKPYIDFLPRLIHVLQNQ